jgi:hypothetical protein
MTLSQFITRTYLMATGKITPPVAGNPKYDKLVALGNMYTEQWALESGVDWESLRTTFTLGTVSATDTYDLDPDMGKLSSQEGDFVRITQPTQEYKYTIVPSTRLYDGEQKLLHFDNHRCAVMGQSLVFAHSFLATDPQFGGTITTPGYANPDPLANPNDVIQVDNPNWLVQMCAAEFIRTDLVRQGQYPNLIAMATETMKSMKEQNESQQERVLALWTPGVPNDGPWE